ncbi:uncharacterized protein LOC110859439 isoform X2 [Folsomia candida]|uniref:uncharacterized protein LOC110859439 isoform X2 n=1 Tax=Folsomia candida TaxID=158441 RepID=UPI00160520CD|nr:uncharacterized protein LOC110859439 isoform X2 [Folsomia candida]
MFLEGAVRQQEWVRLGRLGLLGVVVILLVCPALGRNLGGGGTGAMMADHHHQQPVSEGHEEEMSMNLHPIDVCIFSCDLCFKSEALVHCANACILSEGAMEANWRRICKVFQPPATPLGFL